LTSKRSIPTTRAMIAATPSPMIVAEPFSRSRSLPTVTVARTAPKITAMMGMSRAGMKSLLPYRSARVTRSPAEVVSSRPLPG